MASEELSLRKKFSLVAVGSIVATALFFGCVNAQTDLAKLGRDLHEHKAKSSANHQTLQVRPLAASAKAPGQ